MHARLRHATQDSFWEQAVRTELNCTLPIEVTHHGKDEFDAKLIKMLAVRSAQALLTLSSAPSPPAGLLVQMLQHCDALCFAVVTVVTAMKSLKT